MEEGGITDFDSTEKDGTYLCLMSDQQTTFQIIIMEAYNYNETFIRC